MKKITAYLLGILTGIVLTLVFCIIVARCSSGNTGFRGLVLFDEPEDVVDVNPIYVFQALGNGGALVSYGSGICQDVDAFLYLEPGVELYDDQEIQLSDNKCFRQIGVFKYTSKGGVDKTLPALGVYEK